MRWRFADLANCVEAKRYRALVAKIDDWWQEFAGKTDLLRAHFKGQTQWDLPEWMTDHLQAIHPDLMWEFGPAVHGEGHRLVITPEFRHFLLPLITTILDRAPQLV